jgi:regulator of RNase E activity RraA
LGDRDGVVVVKREEALDVYGQSMAREEKEASIKERLINSETTLDIYGFEAITTTRGLTEE